ncbi:hypothetical protein N7493_011534 [Penicillium malachiteum]|uniref:WD40 repeat-like protein n=1 Tax=Penicillium malachiteum TaxID=1324776 RepID=A0AAD6MQF2_9EURO|nr:hypothetical protein N7493_011534 [Penicillium malachiteum]
MDFSLAAFAGNGGEIQLFDLQSETVGPSMMTGDESHVACLAFSSKGNLLASSSEGDLIQIWNSLNGALCKEFFHPSTSEFDPLGPTIQFSPDGTLFAASYRGTITCFWSCATWELLSSIQDQYDTPIFLPNGGLLMAGFKYKNVYLAEYDINSGAITDSGIMHINKGCRGETLRFSPDGTLIAVIKPFRFDSLESHINSSWPGATHSPSKISVWNRITRKPLAVLDGHNLEDIEAKFSPDNKTLVSTAADGTIRLWALQLESPFDRNSSNSEKLPDVRQIMECNSSETSFAIIEHESRSASWDLKISPPQLTLSRREYYESTFFSPDRSIFFCEASSGEHCLIRNAVTGEIVHQIDHMYGMYPYHATFSADNLLLAINLHVTYGFEEGLTEAVPFSQEGGEAVHECVVILNISTSQRRIFDIPGSLEGFAFSPDGKHVALCFEGPSYRKKTRVEIRDAMTWMLVKARGDFNAYPGNVTWSSGSGFITLAASAYCPCYGIELWDLTIDKLVILVQGLYVRSVAFSPDDRYCVMHMYDGTIQLHDLASMTIIEMPGSNWDPRPARSHGLNFSKFDWRFCGDGQVIETPFGRMDILSFSGKKESRPNRALFLDGHWVVRGFEKVFRLPAAEEIKCVAASGDTLLVAYASKQLEFFDFRAKG